MKRALILFVVLLMSAALSASPAAAAGPTVANGGGRGTVDGMSPFSQFGFAVTRAAGGEVQGHFNCLMAGASEFPGFDLMQVRGQITSVAIAGSTATFDGAGTFQTGNQGRAPATFGSSWRRVGPA